MKTITDITNKCIRCGKEALEKEMFYFGRLTEEDIRVLCYDCYHNESKKRIK